MDVLDELERRFAEAIEADQAASRRPRPQRRPRRLPVLPLATAGALATLTVIGIVVLTLAAGGGGDGGRRAQPASSPVLLERAAEAAEHAPPPPALRDGELWYVRGEGVDQWSARKPMPGRSNAFEGFGLRRRYSVEQWSGLGREGRIRRLTLSVVPTFARDRAAWNATPPSQRLLPPDDDVLFGDTRGLPLQTGLLTPQQLRDLPTEPEALLKTIETAVRRGAPQTADADALATASFEAIRELLLLPVAPAQRAALLRAWALLPGTRVARIDTDAHGRRGVVLVYTPRTHPRMPRVLVVDDEDGRLLAERGPRNSPETTYTVQSVAPNVLVLPPGVAPPKAGLPRTQRARTSPQTVPGMP